MKKSKLVFVILIRIINLNIAVAKKSITHLQSPSSIGESDRFIEIAS
jgi:hypothetical protein